MAKKANGNGGAKLGFEATLWAAADPASAGRNNRDAAEYKHVVLGLMFLKYIAIERDNPVLIVLRELAKGDPTFLERCSQHPDAQGRKRLYIARTPEEPYPDREDLRDMSEALSGNWFVATNLNNILRTATPASHLFADPRTVNL